MQKNRMNIVPCYRAVHLLPYIEFLKNIGAPIEGGLRRAKLPTMIDSESDIYLPNLPTMAFLKGMSASEGIEDLPLRALKALRITDLSPAFVAAAHRSPTLQGALEHFGTYAILEDPHICFWLTCQTATARLCMLNLLPMDQESLRYEDWNQILVLIAIVRAFSGSGWNPEEISFRSRLPLSSYVSEQFPNTRLLTGQDAAAITVPRSILSLPPLDRSYFTVEPSTSGAAQSPCVDPVWDIADSLRHVLPAYLYDGYPPIELAAEITGISVRSLQRRLRESHVTYSTLVQEARCEIASKLLRNTDKKIIDIGYDMGYEYPPHFTRAFKRRTGLSPREYRNQQRSH